MTVANAVKGLQNIIKQREMLVECLEDVSQKWEDDGAKQMIYFIQDFLTRDIGGFEWILGELHGTPSATKMTTGSKIKT